MIVYRGDGYVPFPHAEPRQSVATPTSFAPLSIHPFADVARVNLSRRV